MNTATYNIPIELTTTGGYTIGELKEKLMAYALTLVGSSAKAKSVDTESEREERLYSMFGAWDNDEEMERFENAIKTGRTSGLTRNIVSLDEV